MKTMRHAVAASAAILLVSCGGGGDLPPAGGAPSFLTTATSVRTFIGKRDRYTIARTALGVNVTDRVGALGTTAVSNVQSLGFEDAQVNLGIGDLSKTLPAEELKQIIELYIAFFNRIPDADGMAYWIGQRKQGRSIDQIANDFYSVAVTPDLSALTGYAADMSNDAFIRVIYKNVLGRESVDQGGLDYWNGQLTSGKATRASLIKDILGTAHGFKGDATYGWVADLLDNKFAVGNYFAIQHGLTFAGTPAAVYSKSVAVAAAVKPDGIEAAKALFPIADGGFDLRVPAPAVPSFAQVRAIIETRCLSCHSSSQQNGGVALDSEALIRANAARVYAAAAISDFMPQGNQTGMTQAERTLLATWFVGGRP